MKDDVQVHDLIQHKTTLKNAGVFHLHRGMYEHTLYQLFNIAIFKKLSSSY